MIAIHALVGAWRPCLAVGTGTRRYARSDALFGASLGAWSDELSDDVSDGAFDGLRDASYDTPRGVSRDGLDHGAADARTSCREPGRCRVANGRIVLVLFAAFAAALTAASLAAPVHGQIIDLYLQRRVEMRSDQGMEALALRALSPLVVSQVPVRRSMKTEDALPSAPAFEITRWKRVPKLARNWFRNRYADVEWVYEGSNSLAVLDTMRTTEIRSRMQAHFGSPTQTLADFGPLHRIILDEYIQFEYWFVVNDTIPLVVMDVNGPFERGIVAATDARHGDILRSVRDAFLRRLVDEPRREPYVDYYFEKETGVWYRSGYDGERYFLDPLRRIRNVMPGRPAATNRNERSTGS